MTKEEYIDKMKKAIETGNIGYLCHIAMDYIALLESKEWQIVPVEPTGVMALYGHGPDTPSAIYRIMLSAATEYKPGETDEPV